MRSLFLSLSLSAACSVGTPGITRPDNDSGVLPTDTGTRPTYDAAVTPDATTFDAGPAPVVVCDDNLAIDSDDATNAARAIGICNTAATDGHGLISARYATLSGSSPEDLQHGLLANFGPTQPRQGRRLLALSSGRARAEMLACGADDDWGTSGARTPANLGSDQCTGGSVQAYDSVILELRLKAPSNAVGVRFASAFFTREYPTYICTEFNDYFVGLVQRSGESAERNVVFDQTMQPISVNNALLSACEPGTHGGRSFSCPLGRDMLVGTGFDGREIASACGIDFDFNIPGFEDPTADIRDMGASTGWVQTTFPVTPGEEFTIRFALWDSTDGILDSTVLIDDVTWETNGTPPPTQTVPLI